MQIITPGHKYLLTNFEQPEFSDQTIQFIEKEQKHTTACESDSLSAQIHGRIPQCGCGKPLTTVNNGTTNEDVLAVLIDRVKFLNNKAACRENSIVLTHLETALLWLNHRTAERKARGVEGTHKA